MHTCRIAYFGQAWNDLSLSYTVIEVVFWASNFWQADPRQGERGACESVEGTQGANSRS